MPRMAYGGSPSALGLLVVSVVNPSGVLVPDQMSSRAGNSAAFQLIRSAAYPNSASSVSSAQPIDARLLGVSPTTRKVVEGADPAGHDRTVAHRRTQDGEAFAGQHVQQVLKSVEIEGGGRSGFAHAWLLGVVLGQYGHDRAAAPGPSDR